MDEARVYDKLEELAVSQASIISTQESECKENKNAHSQIISHLQVTNGDIADLRRDFDDKAITDANTQGRIQGTIDTMKGLGAVIMAAVAATGTATGIVFGVLRFLEG